MSEKNRRRKEHQANMHIESASRYMAAKDWQAARECLTKALGLHPTADTFLKRSIVYLEMHDRLSLNLAYADVLEALKLEPNNHVAISTKAALLGMNGQSASAEVEVEKLAEQLDSSGLKELKNLVNPDFWTATKLPYKNELFDVHLMGKKALQRERAKYVGADKDKIATDSPLFTIKMHPRMGGQQAEMGLRTLADLKEVLDDIRVEGGVVFTLGLDNMVVDDELVEFLHSLDPALTTGNSLVFLRVKCSAKHFNELFSGEILNPANVWIDGTENVEGFDLPKALELPGLRNVQELRLDMAHSNELFQKGTPLPAYFPDVNFLVDFMERPFARVQFKCSVDGVDSRVKELLKQTHRKLTLDKNRLGMEMSAFCQAFQKRFLVAQVKSAPYRVEINSRHKPLDVQACSHLNQATGEQFTIQVLGSEAINVDGSCKYWVTVLERRDQIQQQEPLLQYTNVNKERLLRALGLGTSAGTGQRYIVID